MQTDPERLSKLEVFRLSTGETIAQRSEQQLVLMVLLRHTGCTFCREMLHDIRRDFSVLAARNILPVLVHMGPEGTLAPWLEKFQLQSLVLLGQLAVISDPDQQLYKAFQLKRGSFKQLFGLKVWRRGFEAGIVKGLGVGKLVGDGFQLSGTFLIKNGCIIAGKAHDSAAEPANLLCLIETVPEQL